LPELPTADLCHKLAAASTGRNITKSDLHPVGDPAAFRNFRQKSQIAAARVLVHALFELDDPLAWFGQDVHAKIGVAAVIFVGQQDAAAKPGREYLVGGQSEADDGDCQTQGK